MRLSNDNVLVRCCVSYTSREKFDPKDTIPFFIIVFPFFYSTVNIYSYQWQGKIKASEAELRGQYF